MKQETRLEGFVDRVARLFDLPEPRTRELLGATNAISAPTWMVTPLPGVTLLHFKGGPSRADADCGLVHVAGGSRFPRHRHLGIEWNLVLSGMAQEDGGGLWLPGDLIIAEPDSVHGYRVLSDEVLFAVVLEGGIEVTESK